MQEWETTQNGCKCALRTTDDASYFLVIRLGPKRSEFEKNVTVVSAVTGCDVTTSMRPRVARLGQIREASLVALREIDKFDACSRVSIVPLVRFTIRSACNSSSSLVSVVPAARRTRLSEISHHTKHRSQSVESFTSQRFRPDVARVHITLD